MCNCGNTITTNSICTNCVQTDCACPIKDFSTDCILYTGEDLPCTDIKQGTIMTELVTQLDTYICTLQTQILNAARLINVGSGSGIYRGVDGLGRKEIRTIDSTDNILTVGISEDDLKIDLSVDHVVLSAFVKDNQLTYSSTNVGTGAGVYKDAIRTGDNVNLSFKKIKSTDGTVIITEGTDDINLAVDGSETKVTAGTAISVTGTGTVASPYVVTNTAPDQIVSLAAGSGISVSGSYPSFSITNTAPDQVVSLTGAGATTISGSYPNFIITSTDTNTPVSITGGGATTVSGSYPNFTVSSTDTTYSAGPGLTLSAGTFGIDNLQKTISGSYTLTNADDNYEIIVNNVATPAIITIPAGLKARISVGFIQQGTADVTFLEAGVTINSPLSMKKIKGQNYNAYITQVENTNVYQLVGNLKLV